MDAVNNANTVATILKVQDWMTSIAETIKKAQALQSGSGPSNPTLTAEINAYNEDGTTIEVSSGPTIGLDDLDMTEVSQPTQSYDFMMMFDDKVSIGS